MIITDRDKGSIEAIDEVLPLAVNLFCSYHQTEEYSNLHQRRKCSILLYVDVQAPIELSSARGYHQTQIQPLVIYGRQRARIPIFGE